MTAARTRMGYEGQYFHGAAGTTAATLLTNCQDQAVALDTEDGETTERGDSTVPPISEFEVSCLNYSFEWTMLNKDSDMSLEALLTAAHTGAPVAFRTKDKIAGKGYDGDVILKVRNGRPLKGSMTYEFSAVPNGRLRTPQPYV